MKKFKSVIAAALAVTMVLTMTACDEEVPGPGGNSGSTPNQSSGAPAQNSSTGGESSSSTGSVATASSSYEDKDVQAAVKNLKEQLEEPEMTVDTRLKWLAWYSIDETTPAAELFKEVYGIPANGQDDSAAGQIFEWMNVSYENRYDRLATLIQGDESPDFFPFEGADFPYGILMNRYQPVTDLFDFSSDKWKASKDMMEQFKLNGQYYCAFWEITLGQLMWYRKSVIDTAGLDDPQELFAQGKWDWDTYLDMARAFQNTGTTEEPKYISDGFGAEDNFMLSTGVPMVSIVDGKLQSNLHDANYERGINFLNTMREEHMVYPRHEVNNWKPNYRAWTSGNTLFFCNGIWDYESNFQKFKTAYKWADDEIKVVPFPKDPKADKHYVQLKQDSFMWVKGSTNRNGVKAWIDCSATAAMDPATTEAAKTRMINNPSQNWTRELLDFLFPLYKLDGSSPVTPIVEFKTGLGPSVYDSQSGESPVNCLVGYPYLTGAETFVTLRETNEPIINSAIDEINAKIQG